MGTLSGKVGFIILISVIVLIFLFYFYVKEINSQKKLALMFLIVGLVGNLLDRVFYGYVIDWISFSFWLPSFNLADCYICAGVAMWIYVLLYKS